jgi:acetolactate synthase-1/2/3 large subunit
MATELAISDAAVSDVELYDVPRFQPHSASEASADAVERAARAIAKAQRPIIITSELGLVRGGPEALVQLASRHAIPVIEQNRSAFNFPTRHPLHLGFSSPAFIKQADVILVVESVQPWPREYANLSHDPTVIQVAQAPLFRSSVPADLSLAGHPALTLRRLTSCLDKQKPDRERITGRFNAYASEHRRGLQQAQTRAIADATRNTITLQFLSYCIGEAIDDEVVLWNELELDPQLVPRRLPDSWFTLSPAPAGAVGGAIANAALTHVAVTSQPPHPEAQRIATERKLPVVSIVYGAKTEGLSVDDPRVLVATLRQALDVARKRRQPVVLNVVAERA